jgi:hypothetical protein
MKKIVRNKDLELFELLSKKTKKKFKVFEKYFLNDTKKFINKIDRDYTKTKKFPTHILKQIKQIDKSKYDSAICILRGALPYALLFEAEGWKIHYLICGRKNQKIDLNKNLLRFNKSVDKTIKEISRKRVLFIENNSYSGNTSYRTLLELKKSFKIKKSDLFLDYFCKKNIFEKNKKRINSFGKIFVASKIKTSEKEKTKLVEEFIRKIKK